MSLPLQSKSAASKTTKGIPTGVLALVVAVLAYETHTGVDVDLETYLPLLIPLGLGGLLKHGIDVGSGRRRANGAGGALAYAQAPPQPPPAAPQGAPLGATPATSPATSSQVSKTELNNAIQAAVAAALRAQGGGGKRQR